MDELKKEIYGEAQRLQKRIQELPKGYISKKIINGKERFYLQWREGEKVKSQYIKAAELDVLSREIEERRELEQELRWMETTAPYIGHTTYYLKWQDEVIGVVGAGRSVQFLKPNYNDVIYCYTKGESLWSGEEFLMFLSERIINRERRDIEKILHKLGLAEYDVFQIALKTHAINARDMLWLAEKEEDKMSDAVSEVFDSIFNSKKDLQGDSVDSPEGVNVKRYGIYRKRYGIYKQRINPISTDIESEIAVYKIGELMKVPCCPCYRVSRDEVFSAFKYNFAEESLVHFRRLVDNPRGDNELFNLMKARPEYLLYFAKMIALDFVTRQDDRHLSNLAIKISEKKSGWKESFYPLYDNGRSLFYEDNEETVKKAVKDIEGYATTFGARGTYLDYVKELAEMGLNFKKVVNLDITKEQVEKILTEAGFTGYRLKGSLAWIMSCIKILKT